ncbi:MAG: type II toxin-antitoxin system HigB family toxin [bacterium]|nr:type II toxin-antitoxin system HigB family toxin [bacterium]
MRIIARGVLRDFCYRHPESEQPLKSWYKFVTHADWSAPADVKLDYPKASILKDNRICFNIGGNKYRLIVRIHYEYRIVYIRFIGTHAEYDSITADTI